jgi:hypothetical protein
MKQFMKGMKVDPSAKDPQHSHHEHNHSSHSPWRSPHSSNKVSVDQNLVIYISALGFIKKMISEDAIF